MENRKFKRGEEQELWALFSALEKEARAQGIMQLCSNVSITARPFFEAMGFSVEKEQSIQIQSQALKNYRIARNHGPS